LQRVGYQAAVYRAKAASVSRLRFKDEDGRDFPEWEEKSLDELCSTFKSGTGITSERISEEGQFPVYGGNGLRGYTDTFTHDGFFALVGRQGALCGNINRSFGKSYISEHAIAVCANDESDTRWLAYKLELLKLNRLSESSAQPGLSVTKLLKIKLKAPKKPEQTKIANFLTAVDEKISQLKQKCDLLTQYKNGVMQQIFSQALRFKDENGEDFSEWEEVTLGEIASFIKDGTHGTHQDSEDGEYYLLSAKNILNGKINYDDSDRKISQNEFNLIYKNYKLKAGDVLLTVVGTIGRVAIYTDEFSNVAFQRSVAFFRFDNQNSQFVAQLFTSSAFQNLLLVNQVVSAQPGIYLGDLAKIIVNIPTKNEQTKIANFLTAIDDKITHAQAQLAAAKQYKQGLLQQMFA
jgi:type I restriction enzyme S subunit